MLPGLDALLHPRPRAEFAACLAASEPFVVHDLTDSVAALTELPLLASLDALLRAWPAVVGAHLPDVDDEVSSIEASPRDARALFASGMGLLFDDVHQHAPALQPWLDAVRADVGLSALTHGRCLVYATPRGKGTAAHFDQNLNFVLQLRGTKTWTLAPNRHVERPLTRCTLGQPVDPELHTYAQLPMPARLPADSRQVVLAPGSMLFVPRGVWHATRADEDSLQLNFTFSAPTWMNLLTAALRGRLALSPAWRQTAAPAQGPVFEALLRDLARDADGWHAADILEVTEAEAPASDAG